MTARRLGLVGCGRWGRHILRELLALGAEVVVADPSEQARLAAAAAGAAVVTQPEDLPDLAGVVVATPASTHAGVVERLLALHEGPIFVEKPFTTDAAAAEGLRRRAGERVFVMHKWRYHPGVERLRELAASGALGPLTGLRTRRLGAGPSHADVDCVWTLAPHDLSIALEVLGHVPAPRTAVADHEGGLPLALTAVLGDSPWMSLELSVRGAPRVREVWLVCGDGMAALPSPEAPAVLVLGPDGRTVVGEEALPGDPPLRRELGAFLHYLRGGPPPRSSAAEGAAEVRVIEELRRLARL